ncbi:MAG: DUF4255 domain-containing protein, partial [bacterium]|nr:DUF4255 domain-containing protein [bacterium]
MIDEVLEVIKEEVDTFLKLKIGSNQGQSLKLVPVVDLEGKPAVDENTVSMSLVKIEEDRHNMSNGGNTRVVGSEHQFSNPPVKLNLYVLFSAAYIDGQEKNYLEAIKRLSYVIAFFQAKNVFSPQNTPKLDYRDGKLNIELYPLAIEEQSHFWGMMGGIYRPSVLYRLGVLVVQEQRVTDVSEPI